MARVVSNFSENGNKVYDHCRIKVHVISEGIVLIRADMKSSSPIPKSQDRSFNQKSGHDTSQHHSCRSSIYGHLNFNSLHQLGSKHMVTRIPITMLPEKL
ncbi:hypothetical protein Lal_00047465, partial [Lupinus albus]